jgi:hypothetical protein
MIIRAAQQYKLGINSFIERLQTHWLDNFADKFSSFSAAEIERFALDAIREAEAKGIESEDETVVYADLCLAAQSGFAAQIKFEEKPDV